jgi:ABC-type ATPase with predicted acetyltransferase domain
MIRKAGELSDGQVYRFKLCRLLDSDAGVWIADEFCSVLDRDVAKIVAYCLQKQARRFRKTLIIATTHTDLLVDLNPSIVIRKGFGSKCSIEYRNAGRDVGQCSLVKDIVFQRG